MLDHHSWRDSQGSKRNCAVFRLSHDIQNQVNRVEWNVKLKDSERAGRIGYFWREICQTASLDAEANSTRSDAGRGKIWPEILVSKGVVGMEYRIKKTKPIAFSLKVILISGKASAALAGPEAGPGLKINRQPQLHFKVCRICNSFLCLS